MKNLFILLTLLQSAISFGQPPAPIFAGNDTLICEGDSLTLTADNPWGVQISWNNGITDGVPFVPIEINSSTTQEYIVEANNNGVLSYDTVLVTNQQLPNPSYIANNLSGCIPLTTNFVSTTPNAVENIWLFGDGGTVSGDIVNYTCTIPGEHDVTLTSIDSYGCSNTITYTSYIYVEATPTTSFDIDVPECLPSNVVFTSTSTGATSCVWNVSNGDNYIGCEPFVHTYNSAGTYDVELITYSNLGCADTLTVSNAIVLEDCVGINELNPSDATLLRTLDLLGRPVKNHKEGEVLIYQFSDGTVKKVISVSN